MTAIRNYSIRPNVEEIKTEIKLSYKNKIVVIVEGDTDQRFYKQLLINSCKILCATSNGNRKENVINIVCDLEADSSIKILGIIDADFWRLDGEKSPSDNILLTDNHDRECMILRSPALEKILNEYGDSDKIEKFLDQKKRQDIRNILLEAGKTLGYLRWISSKNRYGLNFNTLSFSKFINENIDIDKKEVINQLIIDTKIDETILEKELKNIQEKNSVDAWEVCCGHDLVQILCIGFTYWGLYNAKKLTSNINILEGNLRVAYDIRFFSQTLLYKSLQEWQEKKQVIILKEV